MSPTPLFPFSGFAFECAGAAPSSPEKKSKEKSGYKAQHHAYSLWGPF